MVQLQQQQDKFKAQGLQVVGLSYDPVTTLATFSQKKKLSFPLLSDVGSATIKKLGLENKRGLPFPGTVIIGTDGEVKAKLFKAGYRNRHSVEEILAMAKEMVGVVKETSQ